MPYFDVAAETDLGYLPERYRKHSELERVASEAEADVLNYFTAPISDDEYTFYRVQGQLTPYPIAIRPYERVGVTNLGVFLWGYKTDPDDADTDPSLKVAFKREVAGLIVWRLQQTAVDPMLASESGGQGAKTKTYRGSAIEPFPPEFGRWLRFFDSREPPWQV